MSNTRDFLVEIGTEELPPKTLKTLERSFRTAIEASLNDYKLSFEKNTVESFSTPRRLAVKINALANSQETRSIEKLGPAVTAAFDNDGKPSKAAEGFAKSNGVSVADLLKVDTDKGERLCYKVEQPGEKTENLLISIVGEALNQLPIAKRMRWGSSRTEFVRPIHWAVMLFGENVVEGELLGITTGKKTRGHRFHHNAWITINAPAEYAKTLLEQGQVYASFQERQELIRKQIQETASSVEGNAVIDESLLDEVTALVELPVALVGRFDSHFLSVPAEALISSMAEHQKYFHIIDANKNLMPFFITVANIQSSQPEKVIDGNERVIRPRLADAAFFFESDKKQSLETLREKLKPIVFQQKLGSLFDKTQRIASVAGTIAERVNADPQASRRAAELCKADLASDMVLEFDKMQGIAGSYYAENDGELAIVAEAIKEHYFPKFSGDQVPSSDTAASVAIADRLDTIVGIFAIGQKPSGSKDPFALRRAAIGLLQIIVQRELLLDLKVLIDLSVSSYSNTIDANKVKQEVLDYILERFRAWYLDEGYSSEVFMSVHVKGLTQALDISKRIQAVGAFSKLPDATALAAANKRVSNLLAKAGVSEELPLSTELLTDVEEQALCTALTAMHKEVVPLIENKNYTQALSKLAKLRKPVDAFFDNVMVMADDTATKNNRLALLQRLRNLFFEVADVSQLAPQKK